MRRRALVVVATLQDTKGAGLKADAARAPRRIFGPRERHLAEGLAGRHHCDRAGGMHAVGHGDADGAGEDEEELVAGLALPHRVLAAAQIAAGQALRVERASD
jgi:hypothetical protein